AELTRRATRCVHAALGGLCLSHQGNIARSRLVPAGHHTDKGPMDLLFRQSHGIVVGTVWGARRSLRHMTAGKLAFVERLGVHCFLGRITVGLPAALRPIASGCPQDQACVSTPPWTEGKSIGNRTCSPSNTSTPATAIRRQCRPHLWPNGGMRIRIRCE